MTLEELKAAQASVTEKAQSNINENLRLEGEYRLLQAQIEKVEKEGTPVPVTVTPKEDTADGEPTEAS